MTFNDILGLLDQTQARHVLLLCHHNSDPDAVCSAYAFMGLLQKLRPKLSIEIGTGQGVSRLTKNLFRNLPITVNLHPDVEKADAIILLDTNTVQQLDSLAEHVTKTTSPIIVVDHHAAHPDTQALCRLCITNEDASSTCDIVYGFYKEQNIKPDQNQANALFIGMAFDTRHFVLANSGTFKAIADLVDSGVNAQEALSMLAMPMDFSERVARVKACRRARLLRLGNWIIALSHVSAYQASAARALTDLGAHMAAVAGEKGEKIEISMRCTREFSQKTGIHLGRDIAKPLGEALGGMGGGHAMAAGVNGTSDVEIALKRCLRLLKEKFAKTSNSE
ncbi:MAG: DHH family phosphoesterase [Candidatus Bathyarchaeota archaeon]|nr:DHH family phosphoesterase [Candidatus Bathyarchaeota archaeon]